jgi:hypothetical protein
VILIGPSADVIPRSAFGTRLAQLRRGKSDTRGNARLLRLDQRLIAGIRRYIDYWNADAKPFASTATADEILGKVRLICQPTQIEDCPAWRR